MSDAYTTTSAVGTSTTAYEQLAYFSLRPQLHFDRVASVQPTQQSHKGAAVLFQIYADLATATTELTENADVAAVALSDNDVTVTLREYGNAVLTTEKLRDTSYFEIDRDAANIIGFNAGKSQDTIAREVLIAGSNVRFSGGAANRAAITTGDQLVADDVRVARTFLVNRDVAPVFGGTYYAAYIAPDVAYDLRSETGDANWREPHNFVQPTEIWTGMIGAFEGFMFTETSRLSQAELVSATWADAGAANVDVYPTVFCGQQALAKAFAMAVGPMATVRIGPVTDKLSRFHPLGWYWLGGYARFRESCLYRVESMSTIGAN